VDGLVSFGFVVRAGKRENVLDWSWTLDPWLVLDGVEDLVNQELQWSEVYH